MNILFVPPIFAGHASVLLRVARHLQGLDHTLNMHFLYLSWKDFDENKTILEDNSFTTSVLRHSECVKTANPLEWCPDVQNNLGAQIREFVSAHDFHVIIYDAFAWVYETLKPFFPSIRFICSLPGFMSPNRIQSNTISDGKYQPSDINLIWSNQFTYQENHYFLGYPGTPKRNQATRTVLISLGTVVMTPYMLKSSVTLKPFIQKLFDKIIEYARLDQSTKFIFLTSADINRLNDKNIEFWDRPIDQLEFLDHVSVLITHGGNNSVQEALTKQIPMLVIPFFGDQHESGSWVEQNGAGYCIPISCEDELTCTSPSYNADRDLSKLPLYLKDLLSWKSCRFPVCFTRFISPYAIICDKIPFQEGDVLLGCNRDRQSYIAAREGNEYFGFSDDPRTSHTIFEWKKHRKFPLLLDNYGDALLVDDTSWHTGFISILDEIRRDSNGLSVSEMCCKIMDILLSRGFRLHFVIDSFEPFFNFVTAKEMIHIFQNHNHLVHRQIFFYRLTPRLSCIDIYQSDILEQLLNHFIDRLPDEEPIITKQDLYKIKRIKTATSLARNLNLYNWNNVPFNCYHDIVGYRILVSTRQELKEVLKDITAKLSQDGCVAHVQLSPYVEVQVCTLIFAYGMQKEHDTIYKKCGFFTHEEQIKSDQLRCSQYEIQNFIDQILH